MRKICVSCATDKVVNMSITKHSQSVFAFNPYNAECAKRRSNVLVFSLTQSWIEHTIFHTPEEHPNHYTVTTNAVSKQSASSSV